MPKVSRGYECVLYPNAEQKVFFAKSFEKIANQRKNFCHQLSRKITNSYDAVVVEDINMRGLAGSLKLGKSTNDNGFGMFRSFLKYKLEDEGKHFIVINRFYPSSKTCSECGYINKELTLKDKMWACPSCKTVHDRDFNAAVNIKNEGLRILRSPKICTAGTAGF